MSGIPWHGAAVVAVGFVLIVFAVFDIEWGRALGNATDLTLLYLGAGAAAGPGVFVAGQNSGAPNGTPTPPKS